MMNDNSDAYGYAKDPNSRSMIEDAGGYRMKQSQALAILRNFGGILYAVTFRDGTIKIGYTEDLQTRLWSLKRKGFGDPTVVAIKPGTLADEQAIHRSLAGHAMQGREWYNPDPEVLAVVNEWREALGREPIAA